MNKIKHNYKPMKRGLIYLGMTMLSVLLPVEDVWAGHSTHYGKAVLQTTGHGTVYLSTSSSVKEGGSESAATAGSQSAILWNCAGSSSGDSKTYYAFATPSTGYYFAGWSKTSGNTDLGNANPYTASPTSASSTTSSEPTVTTWYAKFNSVTVSSVSPASVSGMAYNPQTSCGDYVGTLNFATAQGSSINDYRVTASTTSGSGTFTATLDSWANNNAIVSYKFVGNGYYGGGTNGSRVNVGSITLLSLGAESSKSASITYTFPDIEISNGSSETISTSPTDAKTGIATFPVKYADNKNDFLTPTFSSTSGGTWEVNSVECSISDATTGTGIVTVNYTFTPSGEIGSYSATLTLQGTTNAGSASKTLAISADVEIPSVNEAAVISNGERTEYATLVEAIAVANTLNTNPTVQVLNNNANLTSTQQIAKSMTLDLNSYRVSATLTSSFKDVFNVNADDVTFVLTDSRSGGAINVSANVNAALHVINVAKGNFLMTKGNVIIVNENAQSYAINGAAGTSITISGGILNSTAISKAYGIYSAGKMTLNGPTVNATTTSAAEAYAVYSNAVLSGDLEDASDLPTTILGGTFNATAATTTAYALRVKTYAAVNNGTFTANAGTYLARAVFVEGGILGVRNGVFNAIAATEQAHAIQIANGAKAIVYGGTFKGELTAVTAASKYATGAHVTSGGELEVSGGTFESVIGGSGTTELQEYACGIYLPSGSKANISGATIKAAITNAKMKGAYGINSATTNPISISNSSIIVDSKYNNVYGINISNTQLTLRNSSVTVNNLGNENYGLLMSGATSKAELIESSFINNATGTGVYGVYVNGGVEDNTLVATDCSFTASAHSSASANAASNMMIVRVQPAGKNVLLKNTTITGNANLTYSTNAYGVYNASTSRIDIDNCDISISSVQNNAYAFFMGNAGSQLNVSSGRFKANATTTKAPINATASAGNVYFYGGYFDTNTNLAKYLPENYSLLDLPNSATEYNNGYRYYVGPTSSSNAPVCKIGSVGYSTLEAALEFVNQNSGSSYTIIMVADYTLPAGDYILPAKATLLLPRNSSQTQAIGASASTTTSGTTPSLYRKLTFASGANLTCLGTIETSAQQKANGQYGANVGMASGPYGQIHLQEGSHIDLENGAKLYCWGFVTGKGTINAKKGSLSLEGFQLGDWCGGTNASTLLGNSQRVFPITHYFYQSIECPITYRPGSRALGSTHVNVSLAGTVGQDAIALVGTSGSMFIMDDNDMSADTWVMKDYDESKDQCVWTINSGASIGNLKISISGYNMNSEDYDLPITTNMSIVLNYGDMSIGQDAVFLPGSKMIVNKEGRLLINGVKVCVYDATDWANTKIYRATYSPSWGTSNPRSTTPVDSEFFLHGKVDIRNNGGLYTTANGANIHSTNPDAGQVIYTSASQGNKTSYYLQQGGTTRTELTVTPAKLLNGDNSYTESSGTSAGSSFIYKDDVWVRVSTNGCFKIETINGVEHRYANPGDFLEVVQNPDYSYKDDLTGTRFFVWDADCYWWEVETTPTIEGYYKSVTADHNGKYNYYEYDSSSNCWKVKTVNISWNVNGTITNYTCGYGTHPQWLGATPSKTGNATTYYTWAGWTANGTTYSNDGLPEVTSNVTFTAAFETHKYQYNITFCNYDGIVLSNLRYDVESIPVYEGETPTKVSSVSKEYVFNGWNTKIDGTGTSYPLGVALPAVTSAGATYYAQFTDRTRQYHITFSNYDGTLLYEYDEDYGTTPTYGGPTPVHASDAFYTYAWAGWNPSLSTIEGNQTYVATYNPVANEYDIIINPSENGSVVADKATSPQNETITLTITPEEGYELAVLSVKQGANDIVVTNNTFIMPKGDVVISATFQKKHYNITIESATNGSVSVAETSVVWGETIAITNTPADDCYELETLTVMQGETPVAVSDNSFTMPQGDVTISATFGRKQFTITFKPMNGDADVVLTVDCGDTPSYGTEPVKQADAQYTYEFQGWDPALSAANADQTYTAIYTPTIRTYTITWNIDGVETTEQLAYGATPSHENPSKEATAQYTYTFAGWTPEIASVTGDATYTANFTPTTRTYAITWQMDDGAVIEITQVAYGITPSYADATKDATAEYTYTFAGWTPEVVAVTGDATYKATFTSTKNKYTITWKNYDGYALKTEQVEYGVVPEYSGDTPTKPSTDTHYYEFSGWTPEFVAVTGDAEYTATFEEKLIEDFTITTIAADDHGTITGGGTYKMGTTISLAVTPVDCYEFTKWSDGNTDNPRTVVVTGDATYTAEFNIIKYTLSVESADSSQGSATITNP